MVEHMKNKTKYAMKIMECEIDDLNKKGQIFEEVGLMLKVGGHENVMTCEKVYDYKSKMYVILPIMDGSIKSLI